MERSAVLILGYTFGFEVVSSHMLGPDTYRTAASAGFHDWRFGKDGVPHPATCATCGRKTDPQYINPNFRVELRSIDLTATYDGYDLVSRRFRNWCERNGCRGAQIVPLPADPDFFVFRATQIVAFDTQRRRTRFEQLCPTCGEFYSVIGSKPRFLKGVDNPLRGGFFRTDIEFASGPEQHPLIIVGVDVAEGLRDSGLTGFDLEPVLA